MNKELSPKYWSHGGPLAKIPNKCGPIALEAIARSVVRNHADIRKCPDRCGLHVIVPDGYNGDFSNVVIIGNAAAFNMNMAGFPFNGVGDRDGEVCKYAQYQGDWDGCNAIHWARFGDRIIVPSPNENDVRRRVLLMSETFEDVGLSISTDVEVVPDLNDWVIRNKDYLATNPIVPYVLSPEILCASAPIGKERERYIQGLAEVAWYTKGGAARRWSKHGVPIPETLFIRKRDKKGINSNLDEIRSKFPNANEFVVSGPGGWSSEQVRFTNIENLKKTVESEDFPEGTALTVQERLPLHSSPCVRAIVTAEGVEILGISKQRMKNDGYDGNVYYVGLMEEYEALVPGFRDSIIQAFEAIQADGCYGNVNIDFLIVDNSKLGSGYEVLAREANMRPAYSQAIQGIADEGMLNGSRVTRIHSKASIETTAAQFINDGSDGILAIIDSMNRQYPNMKIIFLNRAPDETRGSVQAEHHKGDMYCAFVGNANVDENKLNQFELEFYKALEVSKTILSQ